MGTTFSSLKVPNYRLYFTGQSISMIGTWMQMTAQSWLVLTLTHSSTDLGLTVALQALPVLLLGPYGGVIADRVDKRRLMVALQIAMGFQALALGLLVVFGSPRFWEICVLAVILGLNNAFENSARQSFVREMVGKDELRNAITLNSVTVNAARAVGPAHRRHHHRHGRHRGLLPAQRGQLRGRRHLPADHGQVRPATERAGGARGRPAARGPAVRGPHAGDRHPPGDDGPGRAARL